LAPARTHADGRPADQLRPVTIQRRFTRAAPGSVLIQAGRTTVLCTASISDAPPAWLAGQGKGWVTAEYNMLPSSTNPRKPRDRGGKIDSRSTEIQRLIGRSLRAVTDLTALGERLISLDCEVLEADGGTRTLSITGAFIALVDALATIRLELAAEAAERAALAAENSMPGEWEGRPAETPPPATAAVRSVLRDSVAAVSVGIVEGAALLDLDYAADHIAEVDMNVVMTGGGQFVEIQGSGEEATFDDDQLAEMLALARGGIARLTELQREALGELCPVG